jgi:hypothetical protein
MVIAKIKVNKNFVVEMTAKICIEYIPHETKIKKA